LLAEDADVRVLDVRTPAEFESAHIPGAYNVPLDTLAEHAAELERHVEEPVVGLKYLAGFVGAGLTFAALTNTCAMGMALAKLPYNRSAGRDVDRVVRDLTAASGR
jgi:hypothetical protein